MKLKTLVLLTLSLALSSCAHAELKISCSMFPVYDFTRHVTRELADVRLILRPGTEPHEFEPSPLDVKTLNDSDAFIFTNTLMEEWAGRIASTLTDTRTVEASEGIAISGNDPHVWLDLTNAQTMIRNIAGVMCELDGGHSDDYTRNAEEYCAELAELDAKFSALPKDKALVFAGEYSCGYFVRRYGFSYVSAYDGENEPGVKRMAEIIRHITQNHTHSVLSDFPITRVTRSISEQTGTQILIFNTAHNVADTSRSFLQIMADNYESITKFLND